MKRAFSGAKQPMNNEKRGKIRPPNLFLYLNLIPYKAIGFLSLSGLTTALSWIFYYKAIKIGPISQIALIDKGSIVITLLLSFTLLKEPIGPRILIGMVLILAGLGVMIWK